MTNKRKLNWRTIFSSWFLYSENQKIKNIFFLFGLRFFWEILQNIVGFSFLLILKLVCVNHYLTYDGRLLVFSKLMMKNSGMSLGTYIFLGDDVSNYIIKHELGHTIQSKYFGWFYLPIIGVPSFLRAMYFTLAKKYGWRVGNYEAFYFEADATRKGVKYFNYE